MPPKKETAKPAPIPPKVRDDLEPAASTVTAPIEMETAPNYQSPELLFKLDPADVEAVAVQLALLDGERRPYNYHIGRPMWKRWENFARAGLVAAAYLKSKDQEA